MDTWRHDTPTTVDGGPPRPSPPRLFTRLLRRLERLLIALAIALLGWTGYNLAEAHLYQALEDRELDAILRGNTAGTTAVKVDAATTSRRLPPPGSVLGRLEIPRLAVSTIVRAGTDARTLHLAVGHVPGTALPGDSGNVALAGHRDTFFRRLRDIRPSDRIRFVTPVGTFTYAVTRTSVVDPQDIWVLDDTNGAVLTLITCYPFTFVGSAPRRFIVRAELL